MLIYSADFAIISHIIYLHLKGKDNLFTSQMTDDLPSNIQLEEDVHSQLSYSTKLCITSLDGAVGQLGHLQVHWTYSTD